MTVTPEFIRSINESLYKEIVETNAYQVFPGEISGKVVWDIGANRGVFSLHCSNLGAKKIFAVEAQPETFNEHLKKNTAGIDCITPLNFAVTDKTGDVVRLSNTDDHSSLYAELDKGLGQEVSTISLADLTKDYNETDMALKMDIEGAEYDILMNVDRETLRKFSVIYMEIHGAFHPKYKKSESLFPVLEGLGFKKVHEVHMWIFNEYPDGRRILSHRHPDDIITVKYVRVD